MKACKATSKPFTLFHLFAEKRSFSSMLRRMVIILLSRNRGSANKHGKNLAKVALYKLYQIKTSRVEMIYIYIAFNAKFVFCTKRCITINCALPVRLHQFLFECRGRTRRAQKFLTNFYQQSFVFLLLNTTSKGY